MKQISNIIWRNVAGLIAVIILSFFLFKKCEAEKIAIANLSGVQSENTIYKNQLGTLTMRNSALQLTKSQLEKKIKSDKDLQVLAKDFKEIKAIAKTKTVAKIDTLDIRYSEPIPCQFYREGSKITEWYSLDYKSDSLGLTIENLIIPNQQTTITGFKRKNFFSPMIATTEVTNSSPLVHNLDVESYQVIVPKKWYDSKILWLAVGLAGGALIVK